MPEYSTRRQVLTSLAGGAIVFSLGGCLRAPPPGVPVYPRPYSHKPWAAPRISMDAVIRSIAGLRPYRPGGFVVGSETLDNTLIIHNYGHGGGGISLSWGSSALAVREVADREPAEVAVIGCGVMGLTTARLLQDAGWKVTIYTRDVARHTTSNIAAGEWSPFSVHDPGVAERRFLGQLEIAARIAHHAYTNLGPDYGVTWFEVYEMWETPPTPSSDTESFLDLFPYSAILGPGEHPFPHPYVKRYVTMRIEPAILLRRLTQDFQIAGGRTVIRTFANLDQVLALHEAVVFNCTGLGAAKLFGDDQLMPARGQLVFLPPDPAVDFMTVSVADGLLYMLPRTDALVLGGTFEVGEYSIAPDPGQTERIVRGHERLFEDFT